MNFIIKSGLMIVGSVSLVLGMVGIFLPVLPTTPFFLLSAACYVRSSDKAYQRLISNPLVGRYIAEYRENGTIPLRMKVIAILMLFSGILLTSIYFTDSTFVRVVLGVVAVSVATFIATRKSSS
ncbi:MAG TPA: YbaN family protein [Clostridiaceae bacterium]|nr:YbaN family protein [Clostridiaceae bacterium]